MNTRKLSIFVVVLTLAASSAFGQGTSAILEGVHEIVQLGTPQVKN